MIRRRPLAGAAVALLLAGCVATPERAPGKIRTDAGEVFYDVAGLSAEELYVQMRAKGVRKAGVTFFGEYRWDLSWEVNYVAAWTGVCRPAEVRVKLDTQTILPRWQPPADASPTLQAQWNRFVTALRSHQKGHAELAQRAADEVKETLQTFEPTKCGTIKGEAERRAQALLDRYREADDKYDRDTRHGLSQGAVWPLPLPGEVGV